MLPLKLLLRLRKKYLPIWFLIIALIVLSAYYFVYYSLKPSIFLINHPIELAQFKQELMFKDSYLNSLAQKVGLKSDQDIIIKINNQQINSIDDLLEWEKSNWDYKPVKITVINQQQIEREVEIQPEIKIGKPKWFFRLAFILILLSCSLYILIHYYYDKTQFIVIFLALFYMLFLSILPFAYENILNSVLFSLGELTSWLLVIVFLIFQRDALKKLFKWLSFAFISSVFIIFFTIRFYYHLRFFFFKQDADFFKLIDISLFQNSLDFFAYIFLILLMFIVYFKTKKVRLKQHLIWIAMGALIAIPPQFFFYHLPLLIKQPFLSLLPLSEISHYFLAFIPLAYLIGLRQVQGYRFQVFQSRLLFYLGLAFIFLVLFSFFYNPFENFFLHTLKVKAELVGFVSGVTLAIILLNLQFIFQFFIEGYYSRLRRIENSLERKAREKKEGSDQTNLLAEILYAEQAVLITGINKKYAEIEGNYLKFIRQIIKDYKSLSRKKKLESSQFENYYKEYQALEKISLDFKEVRKRLELLSSPQSRVKAIISLDKLIKSAIDFVKADYSKIEIMYKPIYHLKAFCCPQDIIICIKEIFINAYEATLEINAPIEVALVEGPQNNQIIINDSGEVISQAKISNLGRPFYTQKKGHLGLGLFLVRLLLMRNKGSLEFENKLEGGLKVKISLAKLDN